MIFRFYLYGIARKMFLKTFRLKSRKGDLFLI